MSKKNNDLNHFFKNYRGRYSQYWEMRFGLIPSLPASFDNSFDTYELLTWLQRGFKQLLDDFINLELEFEEFKNAIIELIKELIPQLFREFIYSKEFHDRIYEIIFEWYEEFLKPIIDKIWEEIRKIWERLEYLESLINSILGQNYIPLTEGVDYEIVWYNGFRTSQNVTIGVIESSDRYFLRVDCQKIEHDKLVNVKQEHGYGIDVIPESAIFGINFLGDYAGINNLEIVNSKNNGSGIFNTFPKEARASWQANYNVYEDWNGSNYAFVLRSYNDGFNNQFLTDYPAFENTLVLETGIFQYELTALK